MNNVAFPAWAQWLQAFAVLVIAAAGVRIARGQQRIARRKFEFDLYQRRIAIYSATIELLGAIARSEFSTTMEPWLKFLNQTSEAYFLFGVEVTKLLDDIGSQFAARRGIDPKDRTSDAQVAAMMSDTQRWFLGKRAEIDATFKPYMSFSDDVLSSSRPLWQWRKGNYPFE